MGRPKGGKNKNWTAEAKYEIIKHILDGLISIRDRAKETCEVIGFYRGA